MTPIADGLKKIRDEGPYNPNTGICFNMRGRNAIIWLRAKAARYMVLGRGTKTSCVEYPVAGVAQYDKELVAGTLWQSKRRHAYLAWLIEQAEQDGV